MELDILTGNIKQTQGESKKLQDIERELQSYAARGIELEAHLDTEKGNYFVNIVLERLSKRIDELVDADPHAKAFKDILEGLNYKIHLGRVSAERLTRMRIKRVSNQRPE